MSGKTGETQLDDYRAVVLPDGFIDDSDEDFSDHDENTKKLIAGVVDSIQFEEDSDTSGPATKGKDGKPTPNSFGAVKPTDNPVLDTGDSSHSLGSHAPKTAGNQQHLNLTEAEKVRGYLFKEIVKLSTHSAAERTQVLKALKTEKSMPTDAVVSNAVNAQDHNNKMKIVEELERTSEVSRASPTAEDRNLGKEPNVFDAKTEAENALPGVVNTNGYDSGKETVTDTKAGGEPGGKASKDAKTGTDNSDAKTAKETGESAKRLSKPGRSGSIMNMNRSSIVSIAPVRNVVALLKVNILAQGGVYEMRKEENFYMFCIILMQPLIISVFLLSRMVDEDRAVGIWVALISNSKWGFNFGGLGTIVIFVGYVLDWHRKAFAVSKEILVKKAGAESPKTTSKKIPDGIVEKALQNASSVEKTASDPTKSSNSDHTKSSGNSRPGDKTNDKGTTFIIKADVDLECNNALNNAAGPAIIDSVIPGSRMTNGVNRHDHRGATRTEGLKRAKIDHSDKKELNKLYRSLFRYMFPFVFGIIFLLLSGLFYTKSLPEMPLLLVFILTLWGLAFQRYSASQVTADWIFYKRMSQMSGIGAVLLGIVFAIWCFQETGDDEKNVWNRSYKARHATTTVKRIYKQYGVKWENECEDTALGKMMDEATIYEKTIKACQTANFAVWMTWAAPGLTVIQMIFVFWFSMTRLWTVRAGTDVVKQFEALLRIFCIGSLICLVSAYCAAEIGSANMKIGAAIMRFLMIGGLCLFVWACVTFDFHNISVLKKLSPFVRLCSDIMESDWMRGLILLVMFFPTLIMLGVDFVNQRVRIFRGLANPYEGRFARYFTVEMRKVGRAFLDWKVVSVVNFAMIWGIVYMTFFVGVGKVTYISLSALNEMLISYPLGEVILIYYLTGIFMFLLPPVPGIPVYVVGGILLGSRFSKKCVPQLLAKDPNCSEITSDGPFQEGNLENGRLGFWWGLATGVVLGIILKLNACLMQQKLIGEILGKSLYIQMLIGVDKPAIRSIEKILKTGRPTQLNKPKVAVLVGGPDWPTSVVCGILKLPLKTTLLGTTPVIVLILPCVLSGGFMLLSAKNRTWNSLAGVVMFLTIIVQSTSMVYAFVKIQEVLVEYRAELLKSRLEHFEVEKLSLISSMEKKVREERLKWDLCPTKIRVLMMFMTTHMSFFCFVNQIFSESCFRPFDLSSRIDDPYAEDGLDGNPFNVILPLGYISCGTFTLACIAYKMFRDYIATVVPSEIFAIIREEVDAVMAVKKDLMIKGEEFRTDGTQSGSKINTGISTSGVPGPGVALGVGMLMN